MDYLHFAINPDRVLGQMKVKVADGDPYITDGRVATSLTPLHPHRELLVRPVAVGGQSVFTHARELVQLSIKGLEVLPAPGAADAVDMVTAAS